jgi:hypothetical protein
LAASPDALRALGLTAKEQAAPEKGEASRVVWELRRHYRGDAKDLSRRLNGLRQQLIGDVAATLGCSAELAADLVSDHLIGLRKPVRGREGMAAEPEALRVAEAFGVLEAKKEPPPRGGGRSR